MTLKRQTTEESELYPIRTVATLTGINPITLRAWERRYGLIKPVRAQSGHRLYTQENIDAIHRIVKLLDKGASLSRVKNVLQTPPPESLDNDQATPWARYREKMITAITQFDEVRLEELYNELLALYPSDLVTRNVLLPLLKQLGSRWESAEGSVAEEHFFSIYLRNKMGARFHHRYRHPNGTKLLCACLPGENHEIGLLLFALAANDAGHRLVLLGGNMPLADLPHATQHSQCDAIVLSGSIEPTSTLLSNELVELVKTVDVPVFIGGLTSVHQHDAIHQAGAQALGTDISAGIARISKTLAQLNSNR